MSDVLISVETVIYVYLSMGSKIDCKDNWRFSGDVRKVVTNYPVDDLREEKGGKSRVYSSLNTASDTVM